MRIRRFERMMVATLVVSLLMPLRLAGAVEMVEQPALDIALSAAGELQGQVVDVAGQARQNVPVVLSQAGVEVARTTTKEDGRFALSGLAGGLYTIETEGSLVACRAWSPNTAPPIAQPGVLMVSDGMVERGNMTPYKGAWLIGLGLAGIIVAVTIDDDGSS